MSEQTNPKTTPETLTEDVETDAFSTLSGPPKQVKRTARKKWPVWVAVLAAIAVLGGGLFAVQYTGLLGTSETSDAESAAPALDPLVDHGADGVDGITSVIIHSGDVPYAFRKNADGLMTVADFDDLPRDAEAVDSLLKSLLTVTPVSVVKENASEDELKACGLTAPAVTVKVKYKGGGTFSLELGKLDAGENAAYYGREAGKTTVYLFEAGLYQALTKPATEYLAKTLTAAPSPEGGDDNGTAKLAKIELSGSLRPQKVVLRHATDEDASSLKLAGNYVVEAPYLRAINTDTVSPWETGLLNAAASGIAAVHPTEKQLSEYGLTEPHSVADITFAVYPSEEETSNAEPRPAYNRVTYTVSLGNKTEDGGYYAQVKGVDVVYTVAADTVPWAELTYDDVVAATLFLHYITDVSEIELTAGGKTSDIVLTHSGGETSDVQATFTAKVNGKSVTEEDTRALYRLMMMVRRIASNEPKPTPEGAPVLTVRLNFRDGSPAAESRFYEYSANRYLCAAEDGDVYPVKASDVETLLTQIDRYVAGENVTE